MKKVLLFITGLLWCTLVSWADDNIISAKYNDGTTVEYSSTTSLSSALNAESVSSSEDNPIILTVLKDFTGVMFIPEGQYVTLYGGSHTIKTSIDVSGSLTIQDGTYNIAHAKMVGDVETVSETAYSFLVGLPTTSGNTPSLTVNGGTFDVTNRSDSKYALQIWSGTCTINGGIFKGKTCGLYCNDVLLTLNGGTFYGEEAINSKSEVNLGDGKALYVKGDNGWQVNTTYKDGSIAQPVHIDNKENVSLVTINGEETFYNSIDNAMSAVNAAGEGTVTLLSNCSTDKVAIASGSNVTLSGGTNTLTVSEDIYVNGHLTVTDGIYKSTTAGTPSCIDVEGGTLTLNGGTFSGHGGSIQLLNKSVLSALGDGKLYYDANDNLYTGNLLASTISSAVTVKDGSSYEAAVYTGSATVYFETFASALYNTQQQSSYSKPFDIMLLKDCSSAGFEAPADKSFSLYAGNHTLTLTDKVQVKGDLTIGDGTIYADDYFWNSESEKDNMFSVSGTLTVNGGVIDASNTLANAIETSYNSGDVKVSGGTVQNATRYALYINNESTGSALTGGSFSGNYGAIHVPDGMPVCYLLGSNRTFLDYTDDFFANEVNTPVTVGSGDILYKRDVTSGHYGSVCLPYFSKSWSGIEDVYEVESISEEEVTLKAVTSMDAGTPYLFKSDASSVCFNLKYEKATTPVENTYLVGNYAAMSGTTYVPVGSYVLQNNSFRKVTAATDDDHVYSGAYRCYLNGSKVPTTGNAKPSNLDLTLDDTLPSAIDAVSAVMNNDANIYDVNGRRLNALQKGINIVNGKKIIVK